VYRHEGWQYVRPAWSMLRFPMLWDGSHDQEYWHVEGGTAATATFSVVQGQQQIGGTEYVVECQNGNAGGSSYFLSYLHMSPGARYYRAWWSFAWGGATSAIVDADVATLAFVIEYQLPDTTQKSLSIRANSGGGANQVWQVLVDDGGDAWMDLSSLPWAEAVGGHLNVYSVSGIVDVELGTIRQVAVNGIEATEIAGVYPECGSGVADQQGQLTSNVGLTTLNTGDLNKMWFGPHCIEALDL